MPYSKVSVTKRVNKVVLEIGILMTYSISKPNFLRRRREKLLNVGNHIPVKKPLSHIPVKKAHGVLLNKRRKKF